MEKHKVYGDYQREVELLQEELLKFKPHSMNYEGIISKTNDIRNKQLAIIDSEMMEHLFGKISCTSIAHRDLDWSDPLKVRIDQWKNLSLGKITSFFENYAVPIKFNALVKNLDCQKTCDLKFEGVESEK